MDNQKSVLASTTNWAAIIGVLGVVLSAVGYDLGTGAGEDITQAVGATVAAGSYVWVLIERFRRGDLYVKRPKA